VRPALAGDVEAAARVDVEVAAQLGSPGRELAGRGEARVVHQDVDPAVRVDTMSSFEATGPLDTASRLPLLVFRLGVALAFVVFVSFSIMWVRWQTAPGFPGVSADFISFWTAGQLALEGHAVDAYRQIPHYLKQLALHHDPIRGYLAFFYPPFFLLPCAALALLGFLPAVCVWVGTTCLGYAAAMRGMLSPIVREVVLGRAEVRQVFKVSRVGTIVGCYVTSGKITRNAKARVIRDSAVAFDGEIESLRRFKDDVREVAEGFECGIQIAKFQDLKEGDVIEAYALEHVAAELVRA